MGKLIACRACGNLISSDANACPHCGSPRQRSRFIYAVIGVVAFLVFIVFADVVGARHPPPTPLQPAAPTTPAVAPAPPRQPAADPRIVAAPVPPPAATERPINITPEQLRKDYDANEVDADERYRGRTLFVTGLVQSVKKDVFGEPYVELSTSNQFMSVHARFRADAELSKLQRGDRVVARCVGNGATIGSPQVSDCVIEHQYRRVKSD